MEYIGKYKIIRELGAGGFGAVYLAEDPKLHELVAIKVFQIKDDNLARLATSATSDASDVLNQRFLNEARILRQLGKNPHIINVFDFDELDDGRPYYVMPYLPKSLKDVLGSDATDISVISELPSDEKPKRLPVTQALTYLTQLLKALSDVHKAGLVHRDIKPANLLLNEDDEVQLCDFGIAKLPDVQHSQSGIGMGSRNYMAPEQRQSAKHVDSRSDIYSVGVLAYRMITGTLPEGRFSEPNTFQPNLSEALNELVLKALEQQKENRFQDAGKMLKALKQAEQIQTQTDDEETGTWVGGEATQIKAELKPLETKIIELLQKQGEVRESDKVYLQALADIADLNEQGLMDLINQITEQQQNSSAEQKALIQWTSGINKRLHTSQGQLDDTYIESAVSAGTSTTGKSEAQLQQLISEKNSDYAEPTIIAPAKPSAGNQPNTQSSFPKAILIITLLIIISGGGYYGFDNYFVMKAGPKISSMNSSSVSTMKIPLNINVKPLHAKVFLVNQRKNYQPSMLLSPGSYEIEISLAGFVLQKHNISLTQTNDDFQYQLLPVEKTYQVNGIELVMKGIPSGIFVMGSNSGTPEQQPRHRVNIENYRMLATEVTFSLWDECVKEQGCKHTPSDENWARGTHPVINVSYNDIVDEFIPWLNSRLQPENKFRLPSEAEWEYVASTDEFLEYNIVKNRANCKNCGSKWDNTKTAPIQSFSEEKFGLFDIYGNSYEWLADCWYPNYNQAPTDGSAWAKDECQYASVRGGAWNSEVKYLTPKYRDRQIKSKRSNTLGFRLAQDI